MVVPTPVKYRGVGGAGATSRLSIAAERLVRTEGGSKPLHWFYHLDDCHIPQLNEKRYI